MVSLSFRFSHLFCLLCATCRPLSTAFNRPLQ
jgi:hypothetical protein